MLQGPSSASKSMADHSMYSKSKMMRNSWISIHSGPCRSLLTCSAPRLSHSQRVGLMTVENHPKCCSLSENAWHPTRLLDSGPLDTPGNPVIKIIETKATATTGPYMTLSHSWGKGPPS
ncbi:hypothetical protein B0J15DRAFT_504516 [Fusarium solani]|uniref:Uncharacterized protein n=1 Tax=Fusarium solani TaxID=169388 RepID=A0A9P9G9C7_FUSSL|nr:uncharacterized protein B0J15DRAFT_504516 [Fusarium solani]KAH7234608.1 hypothetical protein B0J15DRAFT_504516 [Fusarium solani]